MWHKWRINILPNEYMCTRYRVVTGSLNLQLIIGVDFTSTASTLEYWR